MPLSRIIAALGLARGGTASRGCPCVSTALTPTLVSWRRAGRVPRAGKEACTPVPTLGSLLLLQPRALRTRRRLMPPLSVPLPQAGRTALQVAQDFGSTECIRILEKHTVVSAPSTPTTPKAGHDSAANGHLPLEARPPTVTVE